MSIQPSVHPRTRTVATRTATGKPNAVEVYPSDDEQDTVVRVVGEAGILTSADIRALVDALIDTDKYVSERRGRI